MTTPMLIEAERDIHRCEPLRERLVRPDIYRDETSFKTFVRPTRGVCDVRC